MILLDKRITKALISLRGCAGWSAPVLFANSRREVFSRRGPFVASYILQTNPSLTRLLCTTYLLVTTYTMSAKIACIDLVLLLASNVYCDSWFEYRNIRMFRNLTFIRNPVEMLLQLVDLVLVQSN